MAATVLGEVASCQLPVVSCQWSVASGQLPVVSGQLAVVSGQLAVQERDLGGLQIGFRPETKDPLNVYGGGQQQDLSPLTTDN
jgi:hypothetical protein